MHLLFFWLIRGHAAEGVQWFERILASPSLSTAGRAKALAGSATLFYTQGHLVRSRAAVDGALMLAVTIGDRSTVALAQTVLGHLDHLSGHLDGARAHFAEGLGEFKALGNPWGAGNALSGLAWVALAAGDADEAVRLVDRAAAALTHAGPWFLALGLYIRATVAVQQRRADTAIALVEESLRAIRELHDKFAFVHALVPLAAAAVLKGDDAWAARILGCRDAVAESTGATVADQTAKELRLSAEREARPRLGADKWRRAYDAGRVASLDSLMNDIARPRLTPGRRASMEYSAARGDLLQV